VQSQPSGLALVPNTHKHRRKQMTPYELRFEIFKEARLIATEDFCNRREYSKDGKYIPFPSTQEIQVLANKIKDFGEEK
jgi:hypothetical protein